MSDATAKPLLAILICLASGSLAFGQAGSAGGTIGKTDKSVSGADSAEPQPPTKSRSQGQQRVDKGNSDQPSGGSVSGRWRWNADCSGKVWQGEFDLAESSRGQFNGSFAGTSWHDVGAITNGHINGASISFTRKNLVTQYWTGHLAAGRIKGTSSGNVDCSWEATSK